MNIHCSVGACPSLALWHFGEIGLCQRHWQDWCRYTWEALVDNVDQPVMVDWLATVKLWETVAR